MRSIFLCLAFISFATNQSCEDPRTKEEFIDLDRISIYDFMVLNESRFSSFLRILEADNLDMTLSAYNPIGSGYTLFLPTNQVIDDYIAHGSEYLSLNDLLSDSLKVSEIARFHVVPESIPTHMFPFGALQDYNLAGERLNVSFVIETDSAYYKINNYAPILNRDIKLFNGYIHILDGILLPVTYSNFDWLDQDPQLSIFRSLMDTTGLDEFNDLSTLLVEPDSVYHKYQIFNLEDLIAEISPVFSDYTNDWNPLYYYAANHILEETWFLNDFINKYIDQYSSLAGEEILIDGSGMEIMINPMVVPLDTIIVEGDSTRLEFVGFLYDESNIITQNGAVHFIDRILTTDLPSGVPPEDPAKPSRWFQFYEESLIKEYRKNQGEYLIEDSSLLEFITWSGSDLYYIKSNPQECQARNRDFFFLNGDFYISYEIPEIDTGTYGIFLGAEAYSEANATVDVYLDGNIVGDSVNLVSGGSQTNPFVQIDLGEVEILSINNHKIEIESSVPGRFLWDYIHFKPK